jgi:hypothetical protein
VLEETMPVVMQMYWAGFTAAQYDALRLELDLENNPPDGALFHVMSFDDAGAHVLDLWDSTADFDKFAESRLMPAVRKLQIGGSPQIEFRGMHSIYAPGFTVSLPKQATAAGRKG